MDWKVHWWCVRYEYKMKLKRWLVSFNRDKDKDVVVSFFGGCLHVTHYKGDPLFWFGRRYDLKKMK